MCDVIERTNANKPYFVGKSPTEIFKEVVVKKWPIDAVKPYHCIHCKRPLSNEEMWPHGKATPRAMCPSCYQKQKWLAHTEEECLNCHEWLEKEKVNAQTREPNEVRHFLHDDQRNCLDYFSLISAKALGMDMSFLADEQHQHQGLIEPPKPVYIEGPDSNIIDAEWEKIGPGGTNPRSLPPPQKQWRVPIIPKFYKRKRVRELS